MLHAGLGGAALGLALAFHTHSTCGRDWRWHESRLEQSSQRSNRDCSPGLEHHSSAEEIKTGSKTDEFDECITGGDVQDFEFIKDALTAAIQGRTKMNSLANYDAAEVSVVFQASLNRVFGMELGKTTNAINRIEHKQEEEEEALETKKA